MYVYGWIGVQFKSVGFLKIIFEREDMIVIFCFVKVCVLVSEVVKLVLLDMDQYVKFMRDVRELRVGQYRKLCDSVGIILYGYKVGIL